MLSLSNSANLKGNHNDPSKKEKSALFRRLMYPFAIQHGGFCDTHHSSMGYSHHSSEILSEYRCIAIPRSPTSPLQEEAYTCTPHQNISGCTISPPQVPGFSSSQGTPIYTYGKCAVPENIPTTVVPLGGYSL